MSADKTFRTFKKCVDNCHKLWVKEIENLSDPELLAKFARLGFMKKSRCFEKWEKDAYSLQFNLAAKELLKRLARPMKSKNISATAARNFALHLQLMDLSPGTRQLLKETSARQKTTEGELFEEAFLELRDSKKKVDDAALKKYLQNLK